MYLSHLLIDVGDNPDRPRPGRQWLRNLYHVHQRLSMAFPFPETLKTDSKFLLPFDQNRFQRPHFLFRIDNAIQRDTPRAVVLVQSDLEPNWDYAFQNAGGILAAPPQTRDYSPEFAQGDQYRFRIRLNLTKASPNHRTGKPEELDRFGAPKTRGKRVAFTWDKDQQPDEAVREWFSTKGERCGFVLDSFQLIQLGWESGYRPHKKGETPTGAEESGGRHLKWRAALVEGTLNVSDGEAFEKAVRDGIGHAKAFGFGLLSLDPA